MSTAGVKDSGNGGEWGFVKDPGLERVVATAGQDHRLTGEELDLADTATDKGPFVRGRVVGTSQNTHNTTTAVQIPECDIASGSCRCSHNTILASIATGSHAIGSERDRFDLRFRAAGLDAKRDLVSKNICDNQSSLGIGDGQQG
ncbi:hypothetical protein HG531_003578 [Fusarium graminearum]|nr:hypothetical protein HG531_003578 [Fusarium graminearum]